MKRIGLLTLLTVFINIGLVVRDLILAYKLGNTPELNDFLQCTIVPLFTVAFIAANIPILLIPRLIKADEATMSRYLRMIFRYALGLSVAMAMFSMFLGNVVPGWEFLASRATVVMWVYVFLSTMSMVFRSFHNAKESYATPLIGVLCGSIVTAGALWLLAGTGKTMLAQAYVAGIVVELFISRAKFWRVATTEGAVYPPATFKERSIEVIPLALTGLFIAINPVIDQVFAAAIDERGLSLLLYAGKFPSLVMNIVGTVIGTVALTEFAKMNADNPGRSMGPLLKRGSFLSFGAGLGAAVSIWFLAPILVPFIFERGEFTSEDSEAVITVVRFGVWVLPPYFVGYYLKRYLMALRETKPIMYIYASNVFINFLADLFLSRSFGVAGIACATAVMHTWAASCTIVYIVKIRGRSRSI